MSPRKVYCSDKCAREGNRRKTRQDANNKRVWIEPNIAKRGSKFGVGITVNGQEWQRVFDSIEDARAYRDDIKKRREAAAPKTCSICGAGLPEGSRLDRRYCSLKCGTEARKRGILVKPARALPSTRRRAREQEKARIEARKVEILSGPGTFADVFYGPPRDQDDNEQKETA